MPVAVKVREALSGSSLIRKMFEEGLELKRKYGPDKVFDFSIGNPDLDPPPEFHAALLELAREDPPGSHAYMPNAGYPETRAAMARKVSREHAVQMDAEGIVMCVGAAGGLNVVLKAILDPGDEVLVTKPYFLEYRAYAANHGGVLSEAEARPDFSLDPEAIGRALTARTACVLINSPNNPTGRIYPRADILALAEVLQRHGRKCGRYPYLVSDEPYRELAYGGVSVPPILDAYPHSIVVNSYSKSLSLPGERIGYIAVGSECAERAELLSALIMCNRVLGYVNAPALMQRAVARLVDVRMDMGRYERRRDMAAEGLRGAGYSFAEPEGAFYLFLRSPSPDDAAYVDFLKGYNILTVPGSAFGAPGWIRMSYAVPEDSIRNSMPAFKAALDDWRRRA